MIREERNPAFWRDIASHPEVAPHVVMGDLSQLGLLDIVTHASVEPLASEHGGFLFCRLDGIGRVYELHTMFTPEGWGREVLGAAREAFALMFSKGVQVITTYEAEDWWRSRPPKSFGFVRCGDFEAVPNIPVRLATWALTSDAWYNSPACRRAKCQQFQ